MVILRRTGKVKFGGSDLESQFLKVAMLFISYADCFQTHVMMFSPVPQHQLPLNPLFSLTELIHFKA